MASVTQYPLNVKNHFTDYQRSIFKRLHAMLLDVDGACGFMVQSANVPGAPMLLNEPGATHLVTLNIHDHHTSFAVNVYSIQDRDIESIKRKLDANSSR